MDIALEYLESRKKSIELEYTKLVKERDELNIKLTQLQGSYSEVGGLFSYLEGREKADGQQSN